MAILSPSDFETNHHHGASESPVERVLSRLPDARRSGEGWSARCPAHEDRRASLTVGTGEGGRALLHCHAGCTPEAIVESLSLRMADLMPDDGQHRAALPMAKPSRPEKVSFSTADEAIRAYGKGEPDNRWTYHDVHGSPVGMILRWNTPDGGKEIRPIARTPDNRWTLGAMSEPRPLYNLPELNRRRVELTFVIEGEMAADAAAGLGYLVTTSAGGAKAPSKTDWAPLAGREVIVLPDNDETGEQYARDVAAILGRLREPASVRIIQLTDTWPSLPEGGDIADIVSSGEDRDSIKAKIGNLIASEEPQADVEPSAPAVPPWKPFPVEALPEPARQFVTELAEATSNDPSSAALAAMVTMAGVVGNRVSAWIKPGWSEPAILWGAIVARSGSIKSPVLKLATRPLLQFYKEDRKRYEEALREYEAEVERYLAQRDRWRSAQKKGATADDPPLAPKKPVERQTLVSDVTTEKLGSMLQENPLGLLLVRDELASWIGSFDRYAAGKGSDSPTWLSFFDGSPVKIDRKTAAGAIFCERGSVSVLGTIQPRVLNRIFGVQERESGLLARLLLVEPPSQPVIWTKRGITQSTESDWANLLRGLIELEPEVDATGDPTPRLVMLSSEAERLFALWHNDTGRSLQEIADDDQYAHVAKLKGICVRMALILACVDSVVAGEPLRDIEARHMQSAIEIAGWFKHESDRVYFALSGSDDDRARRRLAELIQRKGGTVTARELMRSSRAFKTVNDSEAALRDLADGGFGTWETP